jgi:hypothetical protein
MIPYNTAFVKNVVISRIKFHIMKVSVVTCSLLASASAHTIFTQLHVNGVAQGQTKGIRVPVRASKANVLLPTWALIFTD